MTSRWLRFGQPTLGDFAFSPKAKQYQFVMPTENADIFSNIVLVLFARLL